MILGLWLPTATRWPEPGRATRPCGFDHKTPADRVDRKCGTDFLRSCDTCDPQRGAHAQRNGMPLATVARMRPRSFLSDIDGDIAKHGHIHARAVANERQMRPESGSSPRRNFGSHVLLTMMFATKVATGCNDIPTTFW